MSEKPPKSHYCFVCNQQCESLEELRSHIVTTHEEGTDYVLCPHPECKVPLRDVKIHVACKHPDFQIPFGYQRKPLIIRDVKINKKTFKKKVKWKTGYFFSKKNNKQVYFRSGLESEFYKVLEKNKSVQRYSAEPIEIEYFFEGNRRRYIPDILVEYNDGKKELWEIKPKSQTKLPKNVAKWQAANEYCKKRNWDFIVLTENGLKILKKKGKI